MKTVQNPTTGIYSNNTSERGNPLEVCMYAFYETFENNLLFPYESLACGIYEK